MFFFKLVHFHILSFVSIVFVNSSNSALEGCHMIWIKSIYLWSNGIEACQDGQVQVCLLSYLSKELLFFS